MELESTETSPDTRYRNPQYTGDLDRLFLAESTARFCQSTKGSIRARPLTDAGCVTRSFAKAVYDQNGLRHEEAVTNLKCQTCLCMNKRYPVAPVAVPDTHHARPGSLNLSQPCQNQATKSLFGPSDMDVRDFANVREKYYHLAYCAYNLTL